MSEIASLTQSARQSAIVRFQVLQPHLEQGVALRQVALEAKIPYRTAHRWLSIYRRSGLAGLSRKARADIGGRRVLSPRMRELIEALALHKPRLSVSALYREISPRPDIRGGSTMLPHGLRCRPEFAAGPSDIGT
jgi:putative transposase